MFRDDDLLAFQCKQANDQKRQRDASRSRPVQRFSQPNFDTRPCKKDNGSAKWQVLAQSSFKNGRSHSSKKGKQSSIKHRTKCQVLTPGRGGRGTLSPVGTGSRFDFLIRACRHLQCESSTLWSPKVTPHALGFVFVTFVGQVEGNRLSSVFSISV